MHVPAISKKIARWSKILNTHFVLLWGNEWYHVEDRYKTITVMPEIAAVPRGMAFPIKKGVIAMAASTPNDWYYWQSPGLRNDCGSSFVIRLWYSLLIKPNAKDIRSVFAIQKDQKEFNLEVCKHRYKLWWIIRVATLRRSIPTRVCFFRASLPIF